MSKKYKICNRSVDFRIQVFCASIH